MRKALFYILVILPFFVSLFFWETLKDPLVLREWASRQNFFVLMLLPVFQTAFLPFHNFTINVASGYIFGPWIGFAYAYIGWLLGAMLAYGYWRLISRLGRMRLGADTLAALRKELQDGWLLIVLGSVLPLISDDALVAIIAITNAMSFRYFVLAFAVGTIPGKLATSFLGDAMAGLWSALFYGAPWDDSSTAGAVIMVLYLFFSGLIAYAERKRIARLRWICTHHGT